MNVACLVLTGLVWGAGLASAQAPALLERYKCYFCHSDRDPKTGPAFVDIAARYRGKPQATPTLVTAVRNGRHGEGPWHMPPHPEVSEADAKKMVQYILSLKE